MEPIINDDLYFDLEPLPSESAAIRDTEGRLRLGFSTFFDYLNNAVQEAIAAGHDMPYDPAELPEIEEKMGYWLRWLAREWEVPDLSCYWMIATPKRFDTEKGRKSSAAAAASFYLAFLKNAQEHVQK